MYGMKGSQNRDIPIFIDSDVAPRLFLLQMKKKVVKYKGHDFAPMN